MDGHRVCGYKKGVNKICNDTQELGAIPWSLLATETAADASLGPLLTSVEQGKPITSDAPTLSSLRPICESLYAAEGVLLYQDRVVAPPSLRCRVLQSLHGPLQWNSEPAPSSTGQGCPRISATLGRAAQTATEMHPHRQPPPLCHQLHRYPHLNPSLQTSSTSEAATTWS